MLLKSDSKGFLNNIKNAKSLINSEIFDLRNPNLRLDQKIRLISKTFAIVTHHLNHRATNCVKLENFKILTRPRITMAKFKLTSSLVGPILALGLLFAVAESRGPLQVSSI